MRLQRSGTGTIQTRRLICHYCRVLPGDHPGLQSLQGPRQRSNDGVGSGQERRRRPRPKRQNAPNLRRSRHLLRLHRRIRARNNGGALRVLHRSLRLQTSKPRLHLPGTGKDVQATIRQTSKRVSRRKRLRPAPVNLSVQHSKSSPDVRISLSHRCLSHKPIMTRGYDNQAGPG